MFKIKLILMLLALGVAGGGFMYVKNLQANLAISEANNLVLEGGIEEQKKLMAQQAKDFEAQKKVFEATQKKNAQLEKDLKFVKNRFNKTNADGKIRDLGDLADSRPLTVERILNNDFNNQIRCNEIAQGSPLTEEEKAVKLKTEPGYNTMCPASANPNYKEAQ
tara:strand:- start:27 stop:518 length:492 start_codon:yes stop_codon:yes gene_type:complete